MTSSPVGLSVVLRVRMGAHDAHYAGELVDGARILALFGDVATELLIRLDGDEGLFRAYEASSSSRPVCAGDYIEASGGSHEGRQHRRAHGVRGAQGHRQRARARRRGIRVGRRRSSWPRRSSCVAPTGTCVVPEARFSAAPSSALPEPRDHHAAAAS